tara:strand:- start:1008 stop:1694 length:687 start_codon:yes stop_codon:yes gene_type:complete
MKLTTEQLRKIIKEELEGVLSEKDDRCTRIAKRKYDVWPSAYASGAVVKCRQGKIWKDVKEEDAKLYEDELITEEELTDEEKAELRKILKDEGGAAGMKNFKDKIDKPEKDIKKAAEEDPKIYQHRHSDYILKEQELEEAEYRGRKVPLNKPMRGDVKKFKVYVKDPKTGNIKKVNFGHGGTSAKKKGEKTMKIRKNNPKARKNFRARHNCDNPGPKTKARYWSCKKW